MTDRYATPAAILAACATAKALAPATVPPNGPPDALILGQPAWYPFEHEAWSVGEAIRQSLQAAPSLKRNPAVLDALVDVARFRNLRRGRQSFVLALGFSGAVGVAPAIADLLGDADVDGQALDTLLNMRAPGFALRVQPYLGARQLWIRKLAEKYVTRYAPAV